MSWNLGPVLEACAQGGVPCAIVSQEAVGDQLGAQLGVNMAYYREKDADLPSIVHTLGRSLDKLLDVASARRALDAHPIESAFL